MHGIKPRICMQALLVEILNNFVHDNVWEMQRPCLPGLPIRLGDCVIFMTSAAQHHANTISWRRFRLSHGVSRQ